MVPLFPIMGISCQEEYLDHVYSFKWTHGVLTNLTFTLPFLFLLLLLLQEM